MWKGGVSLRFIAPLFHDPHTLAVLADPMLTDTTTGLLLSLACKCVFSVWARLELALASLAAGVLSVF